MPKYLMGIFYGEQLPQRSLQLRQGLIPRHDLSQRMTYLSSSSSGNYAALSPDKSYLVSASNSSVNNFWVYKNINDLSEYSQSSVKFGGTMNYCAASDTHYAVGGGSPYLYVFNKNGDLQTISTAGLGSVYCLDFSPDGKYLGVIHSTAPYVRIYKIEDFSFVNGATGMSQPHVGCFSHDSSKFYVGAYSGSVNVSKFDPITGVRTTVSSNSTFAATAFGNYGNKIARYPDEKTIIYCASSNTVGLVYLDTLTDTLTQGPALDQAIGACTGLAMPWYAEDDFFYVNHAPGSSGRTVSKFNLSTKRMSVDSDENFLYRNLLYGNSTAISSMFIIDTSKHRISGTVRDIGNLPVRRMVRAFQRSTADLVAQTFSDPTTGNYTLLVDNEGPFDVQFYTEDGELLNDLFYSKVMAEPIA